MPHRRGVGAVSLAAAHLIVLSLGSFDLGHAYAPEAALAVARRVPSALPLAARWNPAWNAVVAAEVEARLAAEDERVEATLPWRRYLVPRPLPDPAGDLEAVGFAQIVGVAPRRVAAAADALRSAFAAGDPNAMAAGIAELTIGLTDLADPFQVTSLEGPEVPGARARFCDRIESSDLADLQARFAASSDPLEGAMTLAAQSAGVRHSVEDAVRAGHTDRVRQLRRERIEAALSVAQAVTVASWRAANPLMGDSTHFSIRALGLWPNPATRGPTRLSFVLPARAETRLEVLDLAGRKVWSEFLGSRPPGAQGAFIPASVVESLSPGVYVVRVSSGGWSARARWVRLRTR